MQLFGCQFLPLLFGLLEGLGDVVLTRRWLLLLLLAVYDPVYVSLLVGVCNFELPPLRPLHLQRVFARPGYDLMQFLFIIEVVTTFDDMPTILLALLKIEQLSFLNLFDRVEVFLFEVVAFNAALTLVYGH